LQRGIVLDFKFDVILALHDEPDFFFKSSDAASVLLAHLEDLILDFLLLHLLDNLVPAIGVIVTDGSQEVFDPNIFLQLALQKSGRFAVLSLFSLTLEDRRSQRVEVVELNVDHELLGDLENEPVILALIPPHHLLLVGLALPRMTFTDMASKSLPRIESFAATNMFACEGTQVKAIDLARRISVILVDRVASYRGLALMDRLRVVAATRGFLAFLSASRKLSILNKVLLRHFLLRLDGFKNGCRVLINLHSIQI